MCILPRCISQTSNKLTSIQDDCIVYWPTFTTENQAIVRIIVYHGHGFYGTYWHLLRLQSSGEAPCLLFINLFGFLGTSYQLVRRISSNDQIGHDSTLRSVFFQRDFDVTHFHSKSEILIQSLEKNHHVDHETSVKTLRMCRRLTSWGIIVPYCLILKVLMAFSWHVGSKKCVLRGRSDGDGSVPMSRILEEETPCVYTIESRRFSWLRM